MPSTVTVARVTPGLSNRGADCGQALVGTRIAADLRITRICAMLRRGWLCFAQFNGDRRLAEPGWTAG